MSFRQLAMRAPRDNESVPPISGIDAETQDRKAIRVTQVLRELKFDLPPLLPLEREVRFDLETERPQRLVCSNPDQPCETYVPSNRSDPDHDREQDWNTNPNSKGELQRIEAEHSECAECREKSGDHRCK